MMAIDRNQFAGWQNTEAHFRPWQNSKFLPPGYRRHHGLFPLLPLTSTACSPRRTPPRPPPLAARRSRMTAAGVSSRTQQRLEVRCGKKRRGGVAAPDVDEEAAEAGAAEWEGEPLGFEVSTEPMPEVPDPETPDF